MNDTVAPAQVAVQAYGGFTLGGLKLALPMTALREVVPCGTLLPLPCPAPCVVGGIDLRGRVLPVVDLRIVLGRERVPAQHPAVIVTVHEQHLLGLVADSVTGIFEAEPGSFSTALVRDAPQALYHGSARRGDDRTPISILSPAALAALPAVPMVDDPKRGAVPGYSAAAPACEAVPEHEAACGDSGADGNVQLMLMRCGDTMLAVSALVVHATLSRPLVAASPLTGGHCRGSIDWRGRRVPAVDLHALCGFGRLDEAICTQAFIVERPQGYVAFLIGEVVDVVRASRGDVLAVPAFSLARPGLFAGALPLSALPPDVAVRSGSGAQYLLIDAAALQGCEESVSLCSLNSGTGDAPVLDAIRGAAPGATSYRADASGNAPPREMLTYVLRSERATPLDQITEILSYRAPVERPDAGRPLLGFMVNRGRSIPVLCLSRLMGEPGETQGSAAAPPSSVLVVKSDADWVGFAVPALTGIERAQWEPEVPAAAATRGSTRAGKQQLGLFGNGDTERMLPVIDLRGVAAALRSGSLTA